VNELNLQERLKGPLNATDSSTEKIFHMILASLKKQTHTHNIHTLHAIFNQAHSKVQASGMLCGIGW
jgi:hypothetical protein